MLSSTGAYWDTISLPIHILQRNMSNMSNMAIIKILSLVLCLSYLLLFSSFSSAVSTNSKNYDDQSRTAAQQRIDTLFIYVDSDEIEDTSEFEAAMAEIKSLLQADDTARQARYIRFQCRLFDTDVEGETAKAIAFASNALKNPMIQQYHQDWLDLKLCQAWYMQVSSDFDNAIKNYNEVLEDATLHQELLLIADARSSRGALLHYQGHFTQSLEDLITARALLQRLNRPIEAEDLLIGIATIFRKIGDYENALKYYLQIEVKHAKDQELDYHNYVQVMIGIVEEKLGNLEAALSRFTAAYQYWDSQENIEVKAEVAVNLASTFIEMGDIPQAMVYLDEAEAVVKPDNFAIYSFMKLFRAKALLLSNQLDEAHLNIDAARISFDSVSNLRGTEQLLELESKLFSKEQDYQRAFASLSQYVDINKQLNEQRASSKTIAMRTQFNSEQIEQENKHLVENQKLKQQEVEILEINKLQQLIIILMGSIILVILAILTFKQSQKNRLLSILAMTDHLTQLPNRRQIYLKAQSFFNHARNHNSELSVISFDADHFKRINDTFGHEAGDVALQTLAISAQELMRKSQIVGRTGGEEFLILLPETSLVAAMRIATQLVNSVKEADYSALPTGFSLTISAGVSTLQASDQQLTTLINRADEALYSAKNAGRNQASCQKC